MENPYVCVGSDELMGDPEDMGGWYELERRGSFANFFNMYRKAGIPVEEIIRSNTSMIADQMGISRDLLDSTELEEAIMEQTNITDMMAEDSTTDDLLALFHD